MTVISIYQKKEASSVEKFLGISSALIGTTIVIGVDKFVMGGDSNYEIMFGNLLLLGNTFCFAVYIVGQKQMTEIYPYPVHLVCWTYFLGGMLVCFLSLFYFPEFISNMDRFPSIGWVICFSVCCTYIRKDWHLVHWNYWILL